MRLTRSFVPVLLVLLLGSTLCAQVTTYTIDSSTGLHTGGCTGPSPCLCPIILIGGINGTFTLEYTGTSGGFDQYDVANIDWVVDNVPGDPYFVSGTGTYSIDTAAGMQQMDLTLTLTYSPGSIVRDYTSGLVPVDVSFPDQIDIGIFFQITPCTFDGLSFTADNTTPPPVPEFQRGDCDADGAFALSDAIAVLSALFLGDPVTCVDACDVNDDGSFGLGDAIYELNYFFVPGSMQPPAPFPGCGEDPTSDGLDCVADAACMP